MYEYLLSIINIVHLTARIYFGMLGGTRHSVVCHNLLICDQMQVIPFNR